MRKSSKVKLAIATLTSCLALNAIAFASGLSDIKGHWAEENITSLAAKKIINGYPDKTFRPNNNISREEVSKILSIYMGEKEVENDKLSDIENRWSTKFIKHLVSEEIITGYPDGTFKPSNNVTRAEFATIAYKYLERENKLVEGQINKLSDIESHWAKENIEGIAKLGYITGYPDGTFKPNSPITRAEVSKIVSLIDGFKEPEKPTEPEKPIEPEKPVEPEKPKNDGISLDEAITNQGEWEGIINQMGTDPKFYYQKLPVQLSEGQPKITEFAFMDDKKDALAFLADGNMRTPQVLFLKGNKILGGASVTADVREIQKGNFVYRGIDGRNPELWEQADSLALYHSRENKVFVIPKTEIKSGYDKYGWVY